MSDKLFHFYPNNLTKAALVYEGQEITYASLSEKSRELGKLLIQLEITGRIGLCVGNEPLFIKGIAGIHEIGGSIVFFNPDAKLSELTQQLTSLQLKYIITNKTTANLIEQLSFAPKLIDYQEDKIFGDLFIWELTAITDEAKSESNNPLDKEFTVMFTSGTSGTSRIVSRSYGNIQQELVGLFDTFAYTEKDKFVCPVPVFHCYGLLNAVMASLKANACLYLFPKFIPTEVLQVVTASKATVLIGVPFMYDLLNQVEEAATIDISSLKVCLSATAKLHVDIAYLFKKRYGIFINQLYGSTETGAVSVNLFQEGFNDVQSVGQPFKGANILLVDSKGNAVPIGAEGEIKIESKAIMQGYLNDAERNKEVLKDGGYFPGDLGRFDKAGNLYIVGRKSSFINVAGKKVDPFEIEQVLLQIEGVEECGVVGIPHAKTESIIIAGMVTNQPISEAAILKFCATKLTNYKIPHKLYFLESLPKSGVGKILKSKLKEQFIKQFNQEVSVKETSSLDQLTSTNSTGRSQIIKGNITKLIQEALYIEKTELDFRVSPVEYGLDSIRVIGFVHKMNAYFGTKVPIGQVLSMEDFNSIQGLFEKAVEEQLLTKKEDSQIIHATLGNRYPLSEGQKGLWAIQAANPASTIYNVPIALCLEELASTDLIYEAAQHLMANHPILKVVFELAEDGELYQTIADEKILNKDIATLSGETSIQTVFHELLHQPFNLAKEALRLHIRKDLATQKTYALFVLHHIIIDATSVTALTKAFFSILQDLQAGKSLSIFTDSNYFDFVNREKKYIESEQGQADVAYWQQKLSGSLEKIALPYDSLPITNEADNKYSKEGKASFKIEGTALSNLKAAAKAQKVTLSVYLLAIFKVLLYRLSHTEDIIVIQPTVGRPAEKYNKSIGYYINIMLSRTSLSANQSFGEILQALKKELIASIDHVQYPYPKLLMDLDLTGAEREGLFPVSFNYLNMFEELLHENESTSGLMGDVEQALTDEYGIEVLDVKTELTVQFKYQNSLFSSATIERHLGYFQRILAATTAEVKTNIGEIDLLSDTEKQQLLVEFNDTKVDFPNDKTIIDLFEEQVKKTPNNIAVVFEDRRLTYKELNERANKVGHYLSKTYDIQADDIIALQLERSEWMIIAILGVMKSGAAYLPIATHSPTTRMAYMLEDSQAKALLTDEVTYESAKELADTLPIEVVERIKSRKRTNPQPATRNPNTLAYIIYTSGSTGQPKGVMIEHTGVVNFIQKPIELYGVNSSDNILQFSTYTFDTAIAEIFLGLFTGATVVVPATTKLSIEDFIKLVQIHQITILDLPPKFLTALNQTTFESVRILQLGGEAVDVHTMKHYSQGYRCFNVYGPTEATVATTLFEVQPDWNLPTIPIGTPLHNTEIYILNAQNTITPIGVKGELCIAGTGLARGYLNNPELTAQKFISHPFKEGERLYKTGDVARWLPDGNIEFLGRIDHQLKVRGYRIEAGEIEQALLEHTTIQSAVVIGYNRGGQATELVAYLVAAPNAAIPPIEDLRSDLAQSLPAYMIPAYFVELNNLPLTSNGKVDRKALPVPKATQFASSTPYVAPRNQTEATLADIWEGILQRESIGVNDNFFDLGGHSLKAIQLVALVKQQLQVDVSLSTIFAQPTIANLAAFLTGEEVVEFEAIEPAPIQEFYELSHAQRRLWVLSQMEAVQNAYNMPAAIRITGILNTTALEQALTQLFARHESLRTNFISESGQPRQVIRPAEPFHLKISSWGDSDPAALNDYIHAHAHGVFDLTKDALLKIELLQLGYSEYILLFNMHHIISDGWSMDNLFKELNILYQAANTGEAANLPPLRIQYKDYAAWQHQLLSDSEQMADLRTYWQEQLANLTTLELPTDFPRPTVKTYEGAHLTHTFSTDILNQLEAVSRANGATLFMTLTAMVKVLLYRYSGQEDIVIGTPSAGRNHPDLHDQIGYYINTVALRDQLERNDSFTDTLTKVKQTALAAFERELYPFDQLVEEIVLDRDVSRSPIFDIMLVLQNNEQIELNIKDAAINILPRAFDISKFDFVFSFIKVPEGLELSLEYSTDLFKAETIGRMVQHLEILAKNILADPSVSIGKVDMLPEAERQLIRHTFNDTKTNFPQGKTIIDLFEEQVERTPHAIALSFDDKQWSYQALNQQVNQIAHYLRNNHDIQPNQVIALLVDRTAWLPIGILAVIKAGAAYLPLDRDLPEARLSYMLENSGAKLILSDDANLGLAQQLSSKTLLLEDISATNLTNPTPASEDANHLAYIIYTSGSTGNPKGVLMAHQLLTNFLHWQVETSVCTVGDKTTQSTAYSFDVSFQEIFATWLSGGELVMVDQATKKDLFAFAEFVINKKIERLFLPFAALQELAQILLDQEADISALKEIVTAGEQLQISDALVQLFKRLPNCLLRNHYGSTEAQVVTEYVLEGNPSNWPKLPPVGRPVYNTQSYILNSDLVEVPIGIAGDLYNGGACVFNGYLNLPEITAKKIIPDPFKKGERLYKTGDLARWLPDGNIELLGRADHQLKVRGYRVETGEIEQVLLAHPAIKAAVVVGHQPAGQAVELVAYLIPVPNATIPAIGELRSHLAQSLPKYMVPAYFVEMDSFPRTSSNKVNRKALPEPKNARLASTDNYVAPQNDIERKLVTIWEQLLQRESIGVNDNFFEIGGHSLRAIRLIALVQQKLSEEIKLSQIFTHPTIKELAELIKPTEEISLIQDILLVADEGENLNNVYTNQEEW